MSEMIQLLETLDHELSNSQLKIRDLEEQAKARDKVIEEFVEELAVLRDRLVTVTV